MEKDSLERIHIFSMQSFYEFLIEFRYIPALKSFEKTFIPGNGAIMQLRSTLEFHPVQDSQRMQEFWPACQADYRPGEIPRLVLRRPTENLLDFNELGKIAVLNGRCRNFGVDLIFQCSPAVENQMMHLDLNRIIQIETSRQ